MVDKNMVYNELKRCADGLCMTQYGKWDTEPGHSWVMFMDEDGNEDYSFTIDDKEGYACVMVYDSDGVHCPVEFHDITNVDSIELYIAMKNMSFLNKYKIISEM